MRSGELPGGGGSSVDHPPFSDTLAAARTGAPWAFERLYQHHSPKVAGYLRSRRVPDVDGTTNDVFLRVFDRLATFEGDEDGFRAWTFTIAHHLMVDELRRASRRPPIDHHATVDAQRWTGDTEEEALASMSRDRVRELLDRLSPDQRDVVLLRIVVDLSIEQVAEVLDKQPTAVKALQFRAIAAIRRHLMDEDVSR